MYRTFAVDLSFEWNPMGKERRRFERFRVREGAFAAFINIMAIEWEDRVREITERAGLLPRPLL